jgi:3-methyladenine DNA glycosylase AlkD
MSTFCEQILLSLEQKAIPAKGAQLQHYFKTGPGGYGEGDIFLGVTVPEQRKIAKAISQDASLPQLSELIQHWYHEMRLTGLLALVYKFEKTRSESLRLEIVDFYLWHLDYINNWDLVDTSCSQVLGAFYWKKEKSLFFSLAESPLLWKQRVAMISAFYWIRKGEFTDALALAEKLKNHPHDLMHKAVGWMLREIANRNFEVANEFLKKHYRTLPRTMLRYAIEKFPEELRQDFLKGRI